jgi:hypothetical protein
MHRTLTATARLVTCKIVVPNLRLGAHLEYRVYHDGNRPLTVLRTRGRRLEAFFIIYCDLCVPQ